LQPLQPRARRQAAPCRAWGPQSVTRPDGRAGGGRSARGTGRSTRPQGHRRYPVTSASSPKASAPPAGRPTATTSSRPPTAWSLVKGPSPTAAVVHRPDRIGAAPLLHPRDERASPTTVDARLLGTTTSRAGPASSDFCSARTKQKCECGRSARLPVVLSRRLARVGAYDRIHARAVACDER
jgi:hypothetical protein